MVQVTKQDYQLRAGFLEHQIVEADKKLEKARKQLRNTYLHKKKLIEMLKELERKL